MERQIAQLYNPLLGYVKKRVRSQEDAEDLTQDVFLKLSKSNKDGVENLKSWVYTIAKNTITDYYRKKHLPVDELSDENFKEVIQDKEAIQDLSDCVRSFIKELPEEYHQLMRLSELDNIPQKEIADQYQMNYTTVRSKIQRGRKKLRDVFTDCCVIMQGGRGSILGYESKNNRNRKGSC